MRNRPLVLQKPGTSAADYRHARRYRESQCCTGLLLLVVLLAAAGLLAPRMWSRWHRQIALERPPAAYFPLDVGLDRTTYPRYEVVQVRVKFVDPKARPVTAPGKLSVRVERWEEATGEEAGRGPQWETVTTIGRAEQVVMTCSPTAQIWEGFWPIPWRAAPGPYRVVASCSIDPNQWVWQTPEQKRELEREARRAHGKPPSQEPLSGHGVAEAVAPFAVVPRPVRLVPPGTCVATFEDTIVTDGHPYTSPEGARADWHAILDWATFMGCDSLWLLGGTSGVRPSRRDDKNGVPFDTAQLGIVPEFARAARERGLEVGVWAAAYQIRQKPGSRPDRYVYAQDISRSTGKPQTHTFVSLLDPARPLDLAGLFRTWSADANVGALGLDYIRGETDYQCMDLAARETQMVLPPQWSTMSAQARLLWASRKLEVDSERQKDPATFECWNWWRAHRISEIISQIKQSSGPTKPLWAFLLSWRHGEQHGQDPFMFADAGVDILAVMLYQYLSPRQFEYGWKSWGDYVNKGELNIYVGDQVDDHWHQSMRTPRTSVEEFYRRLRVGTLCLVHAEKERRTIPVEKARGLFVHDVSRIMKGDRGPYASCEWAIAGGAAAGALRADWGLHPVSLQVQAPASVALGEEFTATAVLKNVSGSVLHGLQLQLLSTPGLSAPEGRQQTIRELREGQTLTCPFQVKLSAAVGNRARYMVAFRATWPPDCLGPAANQWPEQVKRLPRQTMQFKYFSVR